MNLRDPAKRAEYVFGQPMQPCPKCGSYSLIHQAPIKMDVPISADDTAKQILGKWARAVRSGSTPLEGPVYIMCQECFHKSPSVDCRGRTSESVGRDPVVAKQVKRLWNDQPR